MPEASSLGNGTISGISSMNEQQAVRCIFSTELVPVSIFPISDNIGPFITYNDGVRLSTIDASPKTVGELVVFCPSPYQFAVLYCSVLTTEGLRWVPTLIYRKLIQSISR